MQSDRHDPDGDLAAARYRSLLDDLEALRDEARAYVSAEVEFQKARAAYAGRVLAFVALFGVLTLALLLLAIMALVLGAVLALSTSLGAWGATGVTAGVLLLGALLFAGLAIGRIRRMAKLISDKEDGA